MTKDSSSSPTSNRARAIEKAAENTLALSQSAARASGALARLIGAAPLRHVHVLVHKPSIADPEVFQQEAFSLYRYTIRLLLERVSWLCRDTVRANEGDGKAELILSNRSAMSYDDLRQYLVRLQACRPADR